MDHQKLIKQEIDTDGDFIDVIKEEVPVEDEPNSSLNRSNTNIKSEIQNDPYNKVHTRNSLHQCHHCNKYFANKSNLRRHQKIQNNEKLYHCDVCDKHFTERQHLIKHQRVHSKEKPYHCDVCGKLFTQRQYLVKHQRVHSKEKPYQCDVCDWPEQQWLKTT